MEVMVSQDVHELLSSHLQFCRVSPSSSGYSCTVRNVESQVSIHELMHIHVKVLKVVPQFQVITGMLNLLSHTFQWHVLVCCLFFLQFVFSGVSEIAGCDSEVVLHQTLPAGCDVGMELQGVWRSRLMLLGLTLELHAYLKGGCVQSCPAS